MVVRVRSVVVHHFELHFRLERGFVQRKPELRAEHRVETGALAFESLHLGLHRPFHATKLGRDEGVDPAIANDACVADRQVLRAPHRCDNVSRRNGDARRHHHHRCEAARGLGLLLLADVLHLVVGHKLVAGADDGDAELEVSLHAHVGGVRVVKEAHPLPVELVVLATVDVGGVNDVAADHVVGRDDVRVHDGDLDDAVLEVIFVHVPQLEDEALVEHRVERLVLHRRAELLAKRLHVHDGIRGPL
mmetsp:Transcript_19079/g.72117  ORF Transcript_19079/g.72117 Transcript_19079/m.72117 type:complete len:247 (+) Transcript_19079:4252-4992(+)